MNLLEITKEWLQANGYDGLYSDDCGCALEDLMPCDNPSLICTAGYRQICTDKDSDYFGHWITGPEKPQIEDQEVEV